MSSAPRKTWSLAAPLAKRWTSASVSMTMATTKSPGSLRRAPKLPADSGLGRLHHSLGAVESPAFSTERRIILRKIFLTALLLLLALPALGQTSYIASTGTVTSLNATTANLDGGGS